MLPLKDFFLKKKLIRRKKKQHTTKKHTKLPSMQRLRLSENWAPTRESPVLAVSDQLRLKLHRQARILNVASNKFTHFTLPIANTKGADQTARMHRLIGVFVVRMQLNEIFSCRGPKYRCTACCII